MALNRLFIYDSKNNRAVCIGKGYFFGWVTGINYIDNWFDLDNEYTGIINKTRFELRTETDLPITFENVTWEPLKKYNFNLIKSIINIIKKGIKYANE